MAKKAKGSRPSAVDPSPPPLPEVGYAAHQTRKCYWCRHDVAIQLTRIESISAPPVFCSERCACSFALDQFHQLEIVWCVRHGEWSLPGGPCSACQLEAKCRVAVANSAVDKLATKESEVANG